MILNRAAYRVRQFMRHVQAQTGVGDISPVQKHLTPAQQDLFLSMPKESQRHCLSVYRTLADSGCGDDELLRAALLHDVGKTGVLLHHRVARVLLGALSPGLLRLWAADGAGPLRKGLHRLLNHAEAGATMVRDAGASHEMTNLVRCHESESDDPRLQLLQEADGAH
jgi:hypothetical protein